MRVNRIATMIVAISLIGSAGAEPHNDAKGLGHYPISIPFELIDNRIFVKAWINDRGPFRCILDTGADAVIESRVARVLSLSVEPSGTSIGVGGSPVDVGKAVVHKLRLGRLRLASSFQSDVIRMSDEKNVFGRAVPEMIIGSPVFDKYIVRIDYQHKRVTFFPVGWQYEGSGTRIHFEKPRQIPVVTAELDGVRAQFGLDTGARSSLLLYRPFVKQYDLENKYKPAFQGITGWGIGGPVRSGVSRAGSVSFGGLTVRNVVIRLSEQASGLTTGSHLDGLIGADILKQFTVYLNYSRNEVIFEKNSSFGQKDVYDRLGAWIGEDTDGFVILDVIPDGPASDAGLKVGDRILTIDGRNADKYLLPDLRDTFRISSPGTSVRLTVRSGESVLRRTVTLRNLI